MKITVTNEDIAGGQRRDSDNCPVARALRRAGVAHLGVGGMAVMIHLDQQTTFVLMPAAAQEWIMEFDCGAQVGPIEFDLTLPGNLAQNERTSDHRTIAPAANPKPVTRGQFARIPVEWGGGRFNQPILSRSDRRVRRRKRLERVAGSVELVS